MLVDENVRRGMLPEEPRYAALRAFGGAEQVKEEYRQQQGLPMIETLMQDVRHGLRQLRRSLGFTAIAVLALALGTGANTAIFSLIDAVMLRMLPVEKPEELFQVQYGDPDSGGESTIFTNPLWEKLRDRQDVFTGTFAWSNKDEFDLPGGAANGSMVRIVETGW